MSDSLLSLWHGDAQERGESFSIWTPQGTCEWFHDTDRAQRRAEELAASGLNVYFGLGRVASPPARGRGKSSDVVAVPGVWADVDFGTRPSGRRYPPDVDAAVSLVLGAGRPTAIVSTGRGIHAYWMFKDPVGCTTPEERDSVAAMVRAWQDGLRALAARSGWEMDSTADLARVLRPTGTVNQANGAAVVFLQGYPLVGVSVDPSGIRATAVESGPAAGTAALQLRGSPDAARDWDRALECLQRIPASVRESYDGWLRVGMALHAIKPTVAGLGAWDHWSEGAPNYEAGACEAKWRTFSASGSGGRAVGLGTLVHMSGGSLASHVAEVIRTERLSVVSAPPPKGEAERAECLERIGAMLGFPVIRFTRAGTEKGRVLYRLYTWDGRLCVIGGGDALLNQRLFTVAVIEQLSVVVGCDKKSWPVLVSELMRIVEDVEDDDSNTVQGRVWELVSLYIESNTPRECTPERVSKREPVTVNGRLGIAVTSMESFLRAMRVDVGGLRAAMRDAGWERRALSSTDDHGARSTRSYFLEPPGPNKAKDCPR